MPAPPSGAPGSTHSVAPLLAEGARRLGAAGISTPDLDAELLLRHVLGWDRAALITRAGEVVPDAAAELYIAASEQRSPRRPLQHLTGVQAFWRHEFLVTPDVLIPRPETEFLVEAALRRLDGVAAPVIVDVGTGSGCIALSLAAERPDATVHAIDISPGALAVAGANAARLGLQHHVHFHEGDLLEPVAALAGKVDLVASNPPYVSRQEWERLEPEVRDHEPRRALVPEGGLVRLYARLFAGMADVLRDGGWALVEIGAGQVEHISSIARSASLEVLETVPDLQGIPRVVVARRPPRA
jgi:release factor glutamine methyltransferase